VKARVEEMKEIDIKLKIVEFLLNSEPADTYLAAEVRFSFGSRRADIVSISSDIATVYEIKSEKDSVERLVYQIDSYKEYFDYCYIVCVNQNLDAVRKKISTNVGIIVVDDINVKRIRKAKRIARQEKLCLASTIPVNELKKIVMNKKGLSKYELCISLANEKKLAEIKSLSRKFLLNNIMKNFDIFHDEIGDILSPDDILTITRMPPGRILRVS